MALGCRALLSQVAYNWRHNLRHDQEDALSTKSLMDAIGREKAQTLMDEAVFQAIEENRAHGLGSSKLMLGYARVSTDDQDLTNQRTELHSAGCIKIFGEKITGVRRDRPELARLLDHLRQGALTLAELRHLVFDEADRMLDMGFMDEIKALLKQIPADRQTLLFSATCDDNLFALSRVLLRDPELIEVAPRNTTAAEVEQRVYAVDSDRKVALVQHMLTVKGWAPALIFSRTRQGADKLAQQLGKGGINALAFHGDLSQSAREKVLLEFRAGTLQALVATDVAARGLDISDLNYVINLEFPHQPEDYVHRIGRTGRAGNKGLAITLFSPEDAPLLEKVEAVLDTRLPQQWFPGFEPDLTRFDPEPRRSGKGAQKQKARKQALAGGKDRKG